MAPLEYIEFVTNPEPRCPCLLLLDTSASMEGEPIKSLNQGLQDFKTELMQDTIAQLRVEICVVTFNTDIKVVQDFVTADQFEPPLLSARGTTHTASGIIKALDIIQDRKSVYRNIGVPHYRPWVFLITDGEPCGEADHLMEEAVMRIRDAESSGHISFFAVGVQGANLEILSKITVRPPVMLQGLKFQELFTWLSSSMRRVSQSRVGGNSVELPPIIGWGSVNT